MVLNAVYRNPWHLAYNLIDVLQEAESLPPTTSLFVFRMNCRRFR